MRCFLRILAVSCAVASIATPALAGPKPWRLGWWPSHWATLNFARPYSEDGTTPHNSQWDRDNWSPDDWIAQRPDEMTLIDGFYKAGILTGQYVEDGVPVLETGPAFRHLGGRDKRRVVETVDQVFQITAAKENGLFNLVDGTTGETIGHYTKFGLQIQ